MQRRRVAYTQFAQLPLLNPDQVERYNEMVARFDSLRQQRGKRHGSH